MASARGVAEEVTPSVQRVGTTKTRVDMLGAQVCAAEREGRKLLEVFATLPPHQMRRHERVGPADNFAAKCVAVMHRGALEDVACDTLFETQAVAPLCARALERACATTGRLTSHAVFGARSTS